METLLQPGSTASPLLQQVPATMQKWACARSPRQKSPQQGKKKNTNSP
jgi:hypothetical protein